MNTAFLDACYGKATSHTPVWFMRQAGRYLPQYRQLKGEKNILDIIKIPELAAQIALQPVDILGVDAAILYADIMVPLLGVGVDLEIVESIGPVIHSPISQEKDIKKLRSLEPDNDIAYLLKTIALLKNELEKKVPLIGFSGAPFTLASYLIEGKPSRDFIKTKSLMYSHPHEWNLLLSTLTNIIIVYLKAQIKAGVQAVQLFDSWAGCLSDKDYKEYVLPFSKKIFVSLQETNIPLIHFGTNTAALLDSFSSVRCHVVGVDWRVDIAKAWKQIGLQKGIQGNLDPVVLLSDFSVVKKKVDEIYQSLPQKKGYIFNLGHGVLPQTPVNNLKQLVEYIHNR